MLRFIDIFQGIVFWFCVLFAGSSDESGRVHQFGGISRQILIKPFEFLVDDDLAMSITIVFHDYSVGDVLAVGHFDLHCFNSKIICMI